MSKYSIDSTTLTSIGNAIRGKEGSSALIPVNDFATRITNLPSGGGGNDYFTQNVVKISQEKRYGATLNATNSFATFMEDPVYEYLKDKIQRVNNINIEKSGHSYSIYTCLYFYFTMNEPASSDISISFVDSTGATISIINNGSFTYDENNGSKVYYYMLRRTGGSYDASFGSQYYQLNMNIDNIDTENKPYVVLGMFNFLKNNQYNFENFEIIPMKTTTGLIKEILENPPVQQIFPAGLSVINNSTTFPSYNFPIVLFDRIAYRSLGRVAFFTLDHLNKSPDILGDLTANSWKSCNVITLDYTLNYKAGLCQDHSYSSEYPYFSRNSAFYTYGGGNVIALYFNFEGESNRRERT